VNVAVFGGSFNPPHVAHVLAASYARLVGFDKVLVVVVKGHAFGKALLPFEHRVRMCELAFEPLTGVEVTRIEETLPQPNYTLHTLKQVRGLHPDWQLRLLVGSDIMTELGSWHAVDEVRQLAPFLVLERVGFPSENAAPAVLPELSSRQVRERLMAEFAAAEPERSAHTRWLEQHVPRATLQYLRQNNLSFTGD
jgi:nicotinate-nucleotide adenylyltransferase